MQEDNERKRKLKSYREAKEDNFLPAVATHSASSTGAHSRRLRMTAYYNPAAAEQEREFAMTSPKRVFMHTRMVKQNGTVGKEGVMQS